MICHACVATEPENNQNPWYQSGGWERVYDRKDVWNG